MIAEPTELYRGRSVDFAARRDARAAQSRRIAWARVVVFLLMIAAFVGGLRGVTRSPAACLLAGGALGVLFLALVVGHSRIDENGQWYDALHRVNEEGMARVERRWTALRAHPTTGDPGHPYAVDLDLFGRASLFQLLDPSTDPGEAELARWLIAPSGEEEIPPRQEAVRTLAPLLDVRQAIAARGRLLGDARGQDMARFVEWSTASSWLQDRAWIVRVARIATVTTVTLVAMHAAGVIATPLWLVPMVVNLAMIALVAPRAHRAFDDASGAARVVRGYASLFEVAARTPSDGVLLGRLAADLHAGGAPAHGHMARLNGILTLSDLRYSAALLALPINALTLWDLHVWILLERWRRRHGPHVARWTGALGEIDALCALAGLAHDNPSWAFPDAPGGSDWLAVERRVIRADGLGHPLLPAASRVNNDIDVGPPGTFLLVTGSNMSGKSTLLRAIGLNVVLAQAGGPVCARRFTLPAVALHTNMRIEDSLEQGLSYFMAALKRLQGVIEGARAHEGGPRTALYLLDEILQGTNTAERQVAVRLVVRHLLRMGAIGAISTHDLTLAATPELAAASRPMHFSERVDAGPSGPVMHFDYTLRPGLATSTNALRLMRLIGLDDGETGGR